MITVGGAVWSLGTLTIQVHALWVNALYISVHVS